MENFRSIFTTASFRPARFKAAISTIDQGRQGSAVWFNLTMRPLVEPSIVVRYQKPADMCWRGKHRVGQIQAT